MVARVTVLARIIAGVFLIVYALAWIPLALMTLIVWDEGWTWFAWAIWVVNPLLVGFVCALFARATGRKRLHG